MSKKPKYMTAYIELEITDYDAFEKMVSEWSTTEEKCKGTVMFEWYISDCKTKGTLIKTFAYY